MLLQPGDQLEKIADLLDQLSLVALAFPAFSDGRSFSKAELLRSRHHFEGAVRATGQVLVDQLPHMLRARLRRVRDFASGAVEAPGRGPHRRAAALLPADRRAGAKGPEIFLAARSQQLTLR